MSENINRIPELFGSMVFNEHVMEQYVPAPAMQVWRQCLKSRQPLPLSALVPAHDRYNRGEARQLHQERARRPDNHGVFRV